MDIADRFLACLLAVGKYRDGKRGDRADAGMNREMARADAGGEKTAYGLLLFAVCGYFFTVSKTALLLYETSNRYQLPIYGILLLLVMAAVYGLSKNLFS